MTPKRLLSLWRERWGKVDTTSQVRPYATGPVSEWGERVSNSRAWAMPGLGVVAAVLFIGLILLLVGVRFTLADQLWLSSLIFIVSLFIRRYQVQMMTLMLMGFATITSSRYLYWRFENTLGPAFSIDFFLALGLWTLEVYGAALFTLGIVNALWPARQAPVPLPDNLSNWPSVSILVFGAGRSAEDVELSVSALRATEWPRSKFSITVVDAIERDSLQNTLTSAKFHYLAYPDETHGAAGLLNRALAASNSELAVIVMAGQTPSPDFLKECIGWFHDNAGLGLLCTPNHFLLPKPARSLMERLAVPAAQVEFLITRISLCIKSGGIPTEPVFATRHLASNLQSSGFGHAYLIEQNGAQWCLHEPFAGRSINWKLWIERAYDVMGVYRSLPRLTLWILPLPYLLAGVELVNTVPMVWLAYALPHLVQAYLAYDRATSTQRRSFRLEVRDAVQSIYLLLLTFFTVVWTQFHQWKKPTDLQTTPDESQAIRMTTSDLILALLHACAIITGVVKSFHGGRMDVPTLSFFLAWSGFVVFLLAAKLAVVRETQEVARQKHRLMVMSAMVRLPNNRTFGCETTNFPASRLELTLLTNQRLAIGQNIKLSLFHQLEEFSFDAQVSAMTTSILTVEVDAAYQEQYARFSQAVFARGADWPNWLPSQHVDRIIPQWLIKTLGWALDMFAHLIHRFDRKPVAVTVDNASMKWNKKA